MGMLEPNLLGLYFHGNEENPTWPAEVELSKVSLFVLEVEWHMKVINLHASVANEVNYVHRRRGTIWFLFIIKGRLQCLNLYNYRYLCMADTAQGYFLLLTIWHHENLYFLL